MGRNFKTDRIKEKIIGYKNKNSYGEEYEVIDYNDAHNVVVKFKSGYICYDANKNDVENGNVKDRFHKNKYGGYLGSKVPTDKYISAMWENMFSRCYSKKEIEKHPTYKDCYVCEEWFCYSTFYSWFKDNKWGNNDLKLVPDKDILMKGNKVYSPNTVILVPHRINTLIIKTDSTRNGIIGTWLNQNGKYTAQCNTGNKTNRNLGSYNTKEEAFEVYKQAKENYIKQIANEYKSKYDDFPIKIYEALCNYKVEEND